MMISVSGELLLTLFISHTQNSFRTKLLSLSSSLSLSLSCDEIASAIHRQFFVPRGFAHGFAVMSEIAVFQYKCDNLYAPESEGAIMWNDPDLNIKWPVKADKIILSEKDKHHPLLKDSDYLFD